MVSEKEPDNNTSDPKNDKSSEQKTNKSKETILKDFKKIVVDFLTDILKTYPELHEKLDGRLLSISKNNQEHVEEIYEYCKKVFPERFFDILYQNEDIYENEEINTEFLPSIDFKYLWKENISNGTRDTLWKYLQLILFTIVSSLSNEESFGDTAKLFEAINQDEFKEKLEETMKNMEDMFTNSNNDTSDENESKKDNPKMPNPKDLHEHLSGMLDGKLGTLAKDIAEETAADFNIDMTDGTSVDSVFKNLFKQPTKLMSLVKNVGSKLDEKMKAGDIKESELLEEASEMMKKMKDMPGMSNFKEMFGKMGMGGAKMDMNAMRNNISKNMKSAKQRERMKEKLFERQRQRAEQHAIEHIAIPPTGECEDTFIEKTVFTTGETYKKSKKQTTGGNKKKKRRKNK